MAEHRTAASREGQVQRLAGLVAHGSSQSPVALSTATFPQFIAAHVMAHLPEAERAPALAWLARFSDELAAPAQETSR
jgi:hypothetical protein